MVGDVDVGQFVDGIIIVGDNVFDIGWIVGSVGRWISINGSNIFWNEL